MVRTWLRVAGAAWAASLWGCGGVHEVPTAPGTIVGSGVLATEARLVGGFTAISVSVPGRMFVERAGSESLVVTAEDNVLSL
jgi:hypothetical protein